MDWNNIVEGIISSLSATLLSALTLFIYKKLFPKKYKQISHTSKRKVNPFMISLFLTIFVIVLTFFSFIYNWQVFNYAYLLIADLVLGGVTYGIFNIQCPKCKRIFTKKLLDKEIMHEEKRPYSYRDCTIYLYTDGSEKDKKYHGKEKTKMETYRTEKEFYECRKCHHKWDKIFERNLDLDNRPKPNIIRTNLHPPNPLEY